MLDDSQVDLDNCSDDLEDQADITVSKILYAGPGDAAQKVLETTPDAVLIDYELTSAAQGATPKHGTSIAAELREQLPDNPILLMTRGYIIDGDPGPHLDLREVVDGIIIKSDFRTNPAGISQRLRSLAAAFEEVSQLQPRNMKSIARLLGLNDSYISTLRNCAPPITGADGTMRAQATVKWINNVLLQYPGIFYDDIHSAAYLGLSTSEFHDKTFQQLFEKAKYIGPLHSIADRWNRTELSTIAFASLDEAGLDTAPTHKFAEAWSLINQTPLEGSRCCVSGEAPAECVCYVLEQPVMRRHSLPYQPDTRPSALDEARVSFKAILETNKFDEELVPEDSRDIALKVQQEGAPDEH